MRSAIAQQLLDRTPAHLQLFARWHGTLTQRISHLLAQQGHQQATDSTPPEITRWLRGEFDFSLKALARLQVELGEELLQVPDLAGLDVEAD